MYPDSGGCGHPRETPAPRGSIPADQAAVDSGACSVEDGVMRRRFVID
jgi:hypothetical protein